ncbi:MAG: ABC transporter ATP-binding protein [archaeon YNP-WB-062]|jgi:iron complex transport system ATP-binding protein|nr:ABC transporter ATP-binding protein [Candidatus Culexarchaeum yellowstonense]
MIITVENLTFRYDSISALRNISIEILGGELVILLGPNGSGKTTFLKCLCRLLKPKAGYICFDKQPIWRMKPKYFAQQVSYVPQTHAPSFPYRVIDVVASGRTPYLSGLALPSEEDYEIAYQALEAVGCRELAERPYTQLSGGELRMVLIARALAQQPKILLLDEPTSNLDFKNKIIVMHTIKNLVEKRGVSAVASEHDPNIAIAFSDKVILMKEGSVIAYGKPDEVVNEETMKILYDMHVETISLTNSQLKFIVPKILLNK